MTRTHRDLQGGGSDRFADVKGQRVHEVPAADWMSASRKAATDHPEEHDRLSDGEIQQ